MHFHLPSLTPLHAAILLAITIIPLYLATYHHQLAHPPFHSTPSKTPSNEPEQLAASDWIQTWLEHPLLPPATFNPSALARHCNATTSRPQLVLRLANANGGIGNVRGNILDFVFLALDTGASLVLPSFARRSTADIADVWGAENPADFAEWFDEEWFLAALDAACPATAVYKPEFGQEVAEAVNGGRGNYFPASRRVDEDVGNDRGRGGEQLERWLDEASGERWRLGESVLVDVERTLWDVDTRSLPPEFRRSFGMLVRVTEKVRRVAAVAVREMSVRFDLGIDPMETIPSTDRGFYGAHLRTERDAKNAGWLNGAVGANFSAQTTAYLEQARRAKLKVMYVASGNASELQAFAAKAREHRPPIEVVSKFDLLPRVEREFLQTMSWDQQALVDYEVLQRCSVFGGFVKSSFSYNVAITRNQWLDDRGRVVIDPWQVQHSEIGVSFDDGLSRMVGRDAWHEHRIPRGMWP